MKVYVDELPKKCEDCPFYKLDTYVDVYGYQTNSHECVLDGSMLINACPLQSLADYTKQVRKEVCEEISWKLNRRLNGVVNGKYSDEFFNGYSYCSSDIENILDKISTTE